MLKKILIGVAVVIAVFLIVVALQPSQFRVERSTVIAAPPAAVFALVNDFHNWEAWSPWAKLDPAVKNSFEGSPAGQGAAFAWAGNAKIGEGRMTILESRPPEFVRIKLDFVKPFAATSTAEFAFKPQGEQTGVSWSMSGDQSFICKGMSLFMNMDKMIGTDFEKGLAQMKVVAENANRK